MTLGERSKPEVLSALRLLTRAMRLTSRANRKILKVRIADGTPCAVPPSILQGGEGLLSRLSDTIVGRIRVVAGVGHMLSMETKLGREYNVVEFPGNNKNEVTKLWMRRGAAKAILVVCDDTNVGILVVHKVRVGREEFILGLGITETNINDGGRYDPCFEVVINRHTSNSIKELVLGFSVAIEVVHKDGGIVPVVLDFDWGQKCCRKGSVIRSVVLWDRG